MILAGKKFFLKTFLTIFFSLSLVLYSVNLVGGAEFTDYSNQLQENLRQQAELQGKIDSSVKQERDLATQISIMDNQIKLTELKIVETDTNIKKLAIDIDTLSNRLDKLQGQVESLTQISNNRIRVIYQQSFANPFAELILNAKGLDDLILRSQYLSQIRKNDVGVLEQLHRTKTNYNDQKTLLSDKKKQQEDLKNKSIAQKASLDDQKNSKDELLRITKNNESNYRSLIAQVKAEYDVIRRALGNSGIKIGLVKRGDVIATIGSGLIGCSTGPHVHFEFNIDGSTIDPKSKLDSGEFFKTTTGYPDNVHQWFGENKNTSFYGPMGHTGIDMGNEGAPIYAADDGEASYVVDQAACVKNGKPGKAITIDHGNGKKTLYLHVQ